MITSSGSTEKDSQLEQKLIGSSFSFALHREDGTEEGLVKSETRIIFLGLAQAVNVHDILVQFAPPLGIVAAHFNDRIWSSSSRVGPFLLGREKDVDAGRSRFVRQCCVGLRYV